MDYYALREFCYAKPFADTLVENSHFRSWVLKKTKVFAKYADLAPKLLHKEMMEQRVKCGSSCKFWWRSHYRKCDCDGCRGGKETDVLAIFETASELCFALHVEVKQPTDGFKTKKVIDQAAAYKRRANSWIAKTPRCVLPHQEATTALLFTEAKRQEYGAHLEKFDGKITYEKIKKAFPDWTPLSEEEAILLLSG